MTDGINQRSRALAAISQVPLSCQDDPDLVGCAAISFELGTIVSHAESTTVFDRVFALAVTVDVCDQNVHGIVIIICSIC